MMPGCAAETESAERYVAGHMPEDEQSAFEEHFFTCDACLARVQDLQTLQQALSGTTASASAGGVSRLRFAWMATAAASLLVIVTVWQAQRLVAPPLSTVTAPPQAATPSPVAPVPATPPQAVPATEAPIEKMAAIVPPRYASLTTRSAEDADAAAFRSAMSRYSEGRYDEAAKGLRSLTGHSPRLGHAQFFLGISELMTGNASGARAALQRAAASGEQPYADEAHFYLAKAALRAGNTAEAERELKIAVSREAGPAGEAARLLKELRSLPR